MNSFEEKRNSLIAFARKGDFEVDRLVLFPSVFKKLSKEGLTLKKLETRNGARNKVFITHVSWKNAYKGNVPDKVSEFISGKTKIYPESEIKNFAQQLYVLSSMKNRSILEKSDSYEYFFDETITNRYW